jgi:hypothetical protein
MQKCPALGIEDPWPRLAQSDPRPQVTQQRAQSIQDVGIGVFHLLLPSKIDIFRSAPLVM